MWIWMVKKYYNIVHFNRKKSLFIEIATVTCVFINYVLVFWYEDANFGFWEIGCWSIIQKYPLTPASTVSLCKTCNRESATPVFTNNGGSVWVGTGEQDARGLELLTLSASLSEQLNSRRQDGLTEVFVAFIQGDGKDETKKHAGVLQRSD